MDKDTSEIPESPCPVCHHALDRATDPTARGHRPSVGDLTVCIDCAAVLKFDDAMKLVAVTSEELAALDAGLLAHVARIRAAIRAVRDQDTHSQR